MVLASETRLDEELVASLVVPLHLPGLHASMAASIDCDVVGIVYFVMRGV